MSIANGYATLADVKNALRITDTYDDTLLELCVETASRSIDQACNRRFYADASASERFYPAHTPNLVYIDDLATLSGLVVKIDSTGTGSFAQTWTLGEHYQAEPLNALAEGIPVRALRTIRGAILPVSTPTYWPQAFSGQALVSVTGRWGFPVVPTQIKMATILQAARLFKRPDSPLGVAGFGEMGAITVRNIDPDVRALISPFAVQAVY
jgi:hypothetical protein